ncbi:hypothetical protein [Actinoplanes sp. NPDC051494]|uniref:hypothetical protein n=1 Tax=Actinoplanes sp. NPDC051494 TaxID=3363907 RepID=UPI003788DFC8
MHPGHAEPFDPADELTGSRYRIVDLLVTLLRHTDLTDLDRFRLLEAPAGELDGEPDPRGEAAGREASTPARCGDRAAYERYARRLTARAS